MNAMILVVACRLVIFGKFLFVSEIVVPATRQLLKFPFYDRFINDRLAKLIIPTKI